jgi:hypothetical protein
MEHLGAAAIIVGSLAVIVCHHRLRNREWNENNEESVWQFEMLRSSEECCLFVRFTCSRIGVELHEICDCEKYKNVHW